MFIMENLANSKHCARRHKILRFPASRGRVSVHSLSCKTVLSIAVCQVLSMILRFSFWTFPARSLFSDIPLYGFLRSLESTPGPRGQGGVGGWGGGRVDPAGRWAILETHQPHRCGRVSGGREVLG